MNRNLAPPAILLTGGARKERHFGFEATAVTLTWNAAVVARSQQRR